MIWTQSCNVCIAENTCEWNMFMRFNFCRKCCLNTKLWQRAIEMQNFQQKRKHYNSILLKIGKISSLIKIFVLKRFKGRSPFASNLLVNKMKIDTNFSLKSTFGICTYIEMYVHIPAIG